MFDPAVAAVEGALAAGAEYADARVVVSRRQSLEALNQAILLAPQRPTLG